MKKFIFGLVFSALALFTYASSPSHTKSIKGDIEAVSIDLNTVTQSAYVVDGYPEYRWYSTEVASDTYLPTASITSYPISSPAMKPYTLSIEVQVLHNSIYFRYWDKNHTYNNYVKPDKTESLFLPKLC